MILRIVSKEIRELGRDPCTMAVLGVYVLVLVMSCVANHNAWTKHVSAQVANHQIAREKWLSQTASSPHQATHGGTTVYKVPSPLASIDEGVAPELGTAIKIEAHKRHEATDSTRNHELKLFQLSFTTPALLIQAVFPLIVILVGHSIVAREREQGTWPLVESLGATDRQIVLGKLIALVLLAIMFTLPLATSLIWSTLTPDSLSGIEPLELALRAIAFYAMTIVYLTGWCATAVALSSRFSSGVTLVLMIACWACWTLLLPRIAVDFAHSKFPLPSQEILKETRASAIQQGSDGNNSLEHYNTLLEQQLLDKYEVL